MIIPNGTIPITEIPLQNNVKLFLKREDLIHPAVTGNKFWKLYHNINTYLVKKPANPLIITFGGPFSNHIAATAALGREFQLNTLGIIRGEELLQKWQSNPTLKLAHENGMKFQFVRRDAYRMKDDLSLLLQKEFSTALIIPEGGTNEMAVEGIQFMLNSQTKRFDYLCTAVGTGGTAAGISKFAEEHQVVLGYNVVADGALEEKIFALSKRRNFLLHDAHDGGYGKIKNENIRFINNFKEKYGIQLDPIYTGKMMRRIFEMVEVGYFPDGSSILAFHTGGLQGISGANELLQKKNMLLIKY